MGRYGEGAELFHGKAGRKALVALYGEGAWEAQARRYAALADRVAEDVSLRDFKELRFYSAPGRTELGGNHTDHNGGRVLCAAIHLDAVACILPGDADRISLVSEGYPEPIAVGLSDLEPKSSERGRPEALVRGVARALRERGIELRGFSGRVQSSVLPGSGLSSSAAFELLVATAIAEVAGIRLKPLELARICQYAENEYFGKPCGLMDQVASASGGIISIDFADPTSPRVKRLNFDFTRAGYAIVVVNTGGSHAGLEAEYAAIPSEMHSVAVLFGAERLRGLSTDELLAKATEIRSACGDRALLRAMHFAAENRRVSGMAKALKDGDLKAYLKLVRQSGDSSWRLLQNLQGPGAPAEQGLCAALAISEVFLGKKGACRVHGGGFAGTIQAYLPLRILREYCELMDGLFGPGSTMPVLPRSSGALRVI